MRPLLHPRQRKQQRLRPWHLFRETPLHIFAACVVLFHLANAAMLPLVLNELAKRGGQTGFVVSAAVIVPQAVAVACSPWAGRLAERLGRRPVLLFGFAALPLRGLLFVSLPDALPLVVIQALDGVSATVFGLAMPLIAADLTRQTRLSQSGHRLARPRGRPGRHREHHLGRLDCRYVRRAGGLSVSLVHRTRIRCGCLAGDAGNATHAATRTHIRYADRITPTGEGRSMPEALHLTELTGDYQCLHEFIPAARAKLTSNIWGYLSARPRARPRCGVTAQRWIRLHCAHACCAMYPRWTPARRFWV